MKWDPESPDGTNDFSITPPEFEGTRGRDHGAGKARDFLDNSDHLIIRVGLVDEKAEVLNKFAEWWERAQVDVLQGGVTRGGAASGSRIYGYVSFAQDKVTPKVASTSDFEYLMTR